MIATVGFGALLVCASCFDVLRLRIPNIIPLGLVVLFALRLLVEPGIDAPLEHFWAMALTLLILLPVFALDMLGGGDIKLLSAVALWLGMSKLGVLLILVGLVGGIFALFWLGMRWCIRTGLPNCTLPRSLQANAPLPFALPIMIAAALLFESS